MHLEKSMFYINKKLDLFVVLTLELLNNRLFQKRNEQSL